MGEIDTFNKYMIGVQGENIVIMNPPRAPISKADALLLAAWIVALADGESPNVLDTPNFNAVLAAVQGS